MKRAFLALAFLASACTSGVPVDEAKPGDYIRVITVRDASTGKCVEIYWNGMFGKDSSTKMTAAEEERCQNRNR